MSGKTLKDLLTESANKPAVPLTAAKPAAQTTAPNNSLSLLLKKNYKAEPAPTPTKDLLHGTGLTKKVAEQAERQHERGEEKGRSFVSEEKASLKENLTATAAAIADLKELEYDESQERAWRGMLSQKYAVLIGAAGTGKTTVLRKLLSELEKELGIADISKAFNEDTKTTIAPPIALCAFTGRATNQIRRAVDKKYHRVTNTIHTLLGFAPVKEFDGTKEKVVFRPTFNALRKLPFKVIGIDEGGMLGIPLWEDLRAALSDDCRVYFIGDINQLPPVMGRSVMGFAMTKWPTFTLEKIHRQAEGSIIISNAHKILRGEMIKPDKDKFSILNVPDGSFDCFKQVRQIIRALHQKNIFDPLRDAFITPQNVGTLGQENLNQDLVLYFNPTKRDPAGGIINARVAIVAGMGHVSFAVGDKVMLTANQKDKTLTNGMTGVVLDIAPNPRFIAERSSIHMSKPSEASFSFEDGEDLSAAVSMFDIPTEETASENDDDDADESTEDENQRQSSHTMIVRFPVAKFSENDPGYRDVTFSTVGHFSSLKHAYAITCHKSQGGEYHTVVILVHASMSMGLNREWLYTAVTRAQERVIILCNNKGLAAAIRKQRITGKTVQEKAQQFLALSKDPTNQQPVLMEPVSLTGED
jgi:ATP-dependent exoDNAse (exonuclease V) alpha subunit